MKEALFWHPLDGSIQCDLCPHNCKIAPGRRGICRVRENRDGRLYALTYGRPVSLAVDPVEKKPLFHVYPGSDIYSVGLTGCNMRCSFCQNWEISQANPEDLPLYDVPPETVVKNALESGCRGIAFTYNEPTISIEYSIDTFKIAKKEGLFTCHVTNGYINPEPARELAKYLDCANVDFKSPEEGFYRRLCKAPRLEAVKEAIRIWKDAGVFVELTNLIIPGENDSPELIDGVIDFVSSLGKDTPLHFSAFHPHYQMRNVPPTPPDKVEWAVKHARERGLEYVYAGNLFGSRWETTYCPSCGSPVIERRGYLVAKVSLDHENRCTRCGHKIPILGEASPNVGFSL